MPDETHHETYAEWHAKLNDAEKAWVETAIEAVKDICTDPEGLVRADFSSEYALVARQRALKVWDGPPMGADDGDRDAKARSIIDRMLASGFDGADIQALYRWVQFSVQQQFRTYLDDSGHIYYYGFPGWAVVELVDGKMTGRLMSGGAEFHPNHDRLDPWPAGERPNKRPWHGAVFLRQAPSDDASPEPQSSEALGVKSGSVSVDAAPVPAPKTESARRRRSAG